MTDPQPDRWQQIEWLYNEALDRDAADREAFLARACGDDEGLRQEVRSLLGYQPANDKMDGKFRTVSVKVKRGKYTVRARPGYVAPSR